MKIKQCVENQLMIGVIKIIRPNRLLHATAEHLTRGIQDAGRKQTLLRILVAG
jgi:hypothetical protein